MTNELFKEYITTILHSDKAGYGFVNDLTDYILSHNAESHVNHIISLWDYCVNQKKTYQVTYFSSSKLNLIGLNRDNILHATTPICSNDENIKTYANNNFIWHDRFIAIPINYYLIEIIILTLEELLFLFLIKLLIYFLQNN